MPSGPLSRTPGRAGRPIGCAETFITAHGGRAAALAPGQKLGLHGGSSAPPGLAQSSLLKQSHRGRAWPGGKQSCTTPAWWS